MSEQYTLFPMPARDFSEKSEQTFGKPRLLKACRDQYEARVSCLDELLCDDHQVRAVWAYVENLDLSTALINIKSVEGVAGRPAIDPRILVGLWLFGTIEGIGSAHVLARYTKEHIAFQWICGDVPIERRTISQFRTDNDGLFDELLAQGVAILMKAKVVTLVEIAQDGLRVRASAGRGSFRREKTLKELHFEAKKRIKQLKQELEEDPAKNTNRAKSNKKRIVEDNLRRINEAKNEFGKFVGQIQENRAKHKKKLLTEEEISNTRISTTDPEARIMKMADGGFRPAYNVQFAVDTQANIIVGVDVVNAGRDAGLMQPMFKKLKELYGRTPASYLADGGYKCPEDIVELTNSRCDVYMPVQERSNGKRALDPYAPRLKECKELGEWRLRMAREDSKQIYKRRMATVELANANARKRGLYQFVVRGLEKVKKTAKMYAIAHNMARTLALGIA